MSESQVVDVAKWMPHLTAKQLERLPRWALSAIWVALESKRDAEARLATVLGSATESPVTLNDYVRPPIALPANARIVFQWGETFTVAIRLDDEGIDLNAPHGHLLFVPRAANHALLRFVHSLKDLG